MQNAELENAESGSNSLLEIKQKKFVLSKQVLRNGIAVGALSLVSIIKSSKLKKV